MELSADHHLHEIYIQTQAPQVLGAAATVPLQKTIAPSRIWSDFVRATGMARLESARMRALRRTMGLRVGMPEPHVPGTLKLVDPTESLQPALLQAGSSMAVDTKIHIPFALRAGAIPLVRDNDIDVVESRNVSRVLNSFKRLEIERVVSEAERMILVRKTMSPVVEQDGQETKRMNLIEDSSASTGSTETKTSELAHPPMTTGRGSGGRATDRSEETQIPSQRPPSEAVDVPYMCFANDFEIRHPRSASLPGPEETQANPTKYGYIVRRRPRRMPVPVPSLPLLYETSQLLQELAAMANCTTPPASTLSDSSDAESEEDRKDSIRAYDVSGPLALFRQRGQPGATAYNGPAGPNPLFLRRRWLAGAAGKLLLGASDASYTPDMPPCTRSAAEKYPMLSAMFARSFEAIRRELRIVSWPEARRLRRQSKRYWRALEHSFDNDGLDASGELVHTRYEDIPAFIRELAPTQLWIRARRARSLAVRHSGILQLMIIVLRLNRAIWDILPLLPLANTMAGPSPVEMAASIACIRLGLAETPYQPKTSSEASVSQLGIQLYESLRRQLIPPGVRGSPLVPAQPCGATSMVLATSIGEWYVAAAKRAVMASSLAAVLTSVRNLIFVAIKTNWFNTQLALTATVEQPFPLMIDRMLATEAYTPASISPLGTVVHFMLGSQGSTRHVVPGGATVARPSLFLKSNYAPFATPFPPSHTGNPTESASNSGDPSTIVARATYVTCTAGSGSATASMLMSRYGVYASFTVLGQTHSQLHGVHPDFLRPVAPLGGAPHVAFNISFHRENALGQAGPYRAFFSDLSRELQPFASADGSASPIQIFAPTPNRVGAIGEGRDRAWFNSAFCSPEQLALAKTAGRLLGIALRTRVLISIDLCSLAWKQLLGNSPITMRDVQRADHSFTKNLVEPLLRCASLQDYVDEFLQDRLKEVSNLGSAPGWYLRQSVDLIAQETQEHHDSADQTASSAESARVPERKVRDIALWMPFARTPNPYMRGAQALLSAENVPASGLHGPTSAGISTPVALSLNGRMGSRKLDIMLGDPLLPQSCTLFVSPESLPYPLARLAGHYDACSYADSAWEVDAQLQLNPNGVASALLSLFGPPPGAHYILVSFSRRFAYIRALLQARAMEGSAVAAAVRMGMFEIVPPAALALLNWREFENKVTGDRDIDIDMLRRHTEYGAGVAEDSPHIKNFWQVLKEFTPQQRRQFIKFAYAQERLPATDAEYEAPPRTRLLIKPWRGVSGSMQATLRNLPPEEREKKIQELQDAALPHADTCFFNVELPAYSTKERMRERLLLAMTADTSLGGDDLLGIQVQTLPSPQMRR